MQEWSGIEAGFQGFSVCIMMYDWNLFVLYFTVSECKDNLLVNPPPKKNETTKNAWDPRKKITSHTPNFRTPKLGNPPSQRQLWRKIRGEGHPQGSHESYETNSNKMHWFFEGKMCDGHQNPSKTWPKTCYHLWFLPLQNLSHAK